VWICFVIGFGIVGMLSGDQPENSRSDWFLAVWTAFGAALLLLSLWAPLARESLTLDGRLLTQTVGIGPLRLRRAYARDEIEDVRVGAEPISHFDLRAGLRITGIGGGAIAFDYGDRTIHVGNVDEAEAKRVVAALIAEGLRGADPRRA
jgi:hypothetical protein